MLKTFVEIRRLATDWDAISIAGSNLKNPAADGGVIAPPEAVEVFLDGVTFRAAS